jgi:hypothetical protein
MQEQDKSFSLFVLREYGKAQLDIKTTRHPLKKRVSSAVLITRTFLFFLLGIPIVYILATVPPYLLWENSFRFLSWCHLVGNDHKPCRIMFLAALTGLSQNRCRVSMVWKFRLSSVYEL